MFHYKGRMFCNYASELECLSNISSAITSLCVL